MIRSRLSRRRFLGQLSCALAVAVIAAIPVHADPHDSPKAPKTVRLLTVGNSFSGDATRLLGAIVKASGNTLILQTVSIPGGSMAQHWEKVEKYEHDPKDPLGLYNSKRSLHEALLAEQWDFVTIQQTSIQSHNLASYRPYAKELYDYIKKSAPHAEILIHQTWAYRTDDPRFRPKNTKPGEPTTQKAMYEQLTHSYEAIASELGTRLIPVGDAYYTADTDPTWSFKPDASLAFDSKKAVYPAVPDQTHSLHMGWYWKTTGTPTPTLIMDGHHSSSAGQYMGACVFYEILFGESAVGNTFVPKGMDPEYAQFLQKTAHEAVARRQKRSGS